MRTTSSVKCACARHESSHCRLDLQMLVMAAFHRMLDGGARMVASVVAQSTLSARRRRSVRWPSIIAPRLKSTVGDCTRPLSRAQRPVDVWRDAGQREEVVIEV
jgi:hypothetical protein